MSEFMYNHVQLHLFDRISIYRRPISDLLQNDHNKNENYCYCTILLAFRFNLYGDETLLYKSIEISTGTDETDGIFSVRGSWISNCVRFGK